MKNTHLETKAILLKYLTNLAELEIQNDLSWKHRLERFKKYVKLWFQGHRAIDFIIDTENSSAEIEESELHIAYIISISAGNLHVLDVCLNYFETSRYAVVGREYAIRLLKSAEIRLR